MKNLFCGSVKPAHRFTYGAPVFQPSERGWRDSTRVTVKDDRITDGFHNCLLCWAIDTGRYWRKKKFKDISLIIFCRWTLVEIGSWCIFRFVKM